MANADFHRNRFLGGDVTEMALPGIGQRYDLRAAEGGSVTVVIHHSGRRDVYLVDDADEPRASVVLSDAQARMLGAIVGGVYFKPAVVEEIEAVIGGIVIDWVTLEPSSAGAGKTIAELEIRSRTRMTVAAILRDHVPIVAPEPTEVLRPGDQLVVIGRQQDLPTFRRHVIQS